MEYQTNAPLQGELTSKELRPHARIPHRNPHQMETRDRTTDFTRDTNLFLKYEKRYLDITRDYAIRHDQAIVCCHGDCACDRRLGVVQSFLHNARFPFMWAAVPTHACL